MNMYDVSYCIGSAQLKIVLTRRKIRIIYTRFGSGVGLDTYLAVDGGLVWWTASFVMDERVVSAGRYAATREQEYT
jgi:hypothetical protein